MHSVPTDLHSTIIPLAKILHKQTVKCLKKFGNPIRKDKSIDQRCEVGVLPDRTMSATLHSHHIGEIESYNELNNMEGFNVPSDQDIITTKRFNKKHLCIINNNGVLTCWCGKTFGSKSFEKQIIKGVS